MKLTVYAISFAVLLSACAQQPPPEPKIFGRSDCQLMKDNPMLQQQFELDKSVCLPRAEAAGVAATANMPMGRGLGLAEAVEKGLTQREIGQATVISCLAERGYIYRTNREHDAACDAIKEQRQQQQRPPGRAMK